jgi:hypothetical protein
MVKEINFDIQKLIKRHWLIRKKKKKKGCDDVLKFKLHNDKV